MKRILLVLLISLFTAVSVMAADNVLQSVQIEPAGDSFNIVLVSDNAVAIKKTVQSPDRIKLSLKGIRASKTLSTVYKNVSNVDNIIVEPFGVDGLNIMFQAENAANAKITFDSLVSSVKVEQRANPKKEILLNAPINTYSPIYQTEKVSKKSSLSNSLNVSSILSVCKSFFSGPRTGTLFTFGIFGLLFLMGAKLIRGKDNEIKVGLSQSLRDRDIAQTKDAAYHTPGYPKNESAKPYTTLNYGLKAYQNSTQSPYLQMHTKTAPTNPISSVNSTLSKRNLMADSVSGVGVNRSMVSSSQPIRRSNSQTNTMTQQKIQSQRVDSVKFLESMSEIYEKSGRPDLANGIRTKLSKIK